MKFAAISMGSASGWLRGGTMQRGTDRRDLPSNDSRRSRQLCRASGEAARVAVLGASGYTGAEAVRLLALHPGMQIAALTSERSAGAPFGESFPHLSAPFLSAGSGHGTGVDAKALVLTKVQDVDWDRVDAVFCCLPHGTTQEIIAALPKGKKVVDLSADFRLRDVEQYAEWYGQPHRAVDLQREFVYGLTEWKRDEVARADLVANPGCYPTCIQLALLPLISAGLVKASGVIVDAKSGVSGAGRAAKQMTLFTEIAGGMNAYGVTRHRHVPEIEQGLAEVAPGGASAPPRISFTPHLIPMSRGMQATCYVELADGASVSDLRSALAGRYQSEPFAHVLPEGEVPHTRHVCGSNHCVMAVFEDRLQGRAVVISVIDNLVKGASGQAVQNMNLMLGMPEETGLAQVAMFP